jgi:hypothetical protein
VETREPGEIEEVEELEELEELEESEELEELGKNTEAGEGPEEAEDIDEEPGELEELEEEISESPESPAAHPMTGTRIDEIASEIEFAESPPEDDSGEDITMNLDIVSPFDVMTFEPGGEENGDGFPAGPDQGEPGPDSGTPLSANTGDEKKNFNRLPPDEEDLEELAVVSETGLEELDSGGLSYYIYRPFSLAGFRKPAPLKTLSDASVPAGVPANKYPPAGERFIEEREGLHYISDDAFKADGKTEKTLDREFKDLVDSVLGETKGDG